MGMGIVHHNNSEENSVDYEAYDEDYVDSDAATDNMTLSRSGIFGRSGVIDHLKHDQECVGTIKIFMNETTGRHLLKLQSQKTTEIPKIQRSPQFHEVGGTCCWKVFSKMHHRGMGKTLSASSEREKNTFIIKSVKLASCDSGRTENPKAEDSYTTQSSLAKSQRLPVASGAPLTSGDSEDHNDSDTMEKSELSQASGSRPAAFCVTILFVLLQAGVSA